MPQIPQDATKNIQIQGPLWSAKAEVIELGDPQSNWAFRNLFLDLTPQDRLGQRDLYLPGTLVLLCFVKRVSIHPEGRHASQAYTWTHSRRHQPTDQLTPDRLRQLLAEGQLALLLVQADPDGWPEASPFNAEEDREPPRGREPRSRSDDFFPTLTCLAGEISLDAFTPQDNARQLLYDALPLDAIAPTLEQVRPVLDQRQGATRLGGEITVHSSGVSLYGQVKLPWQTGETAIAAPFQLTRQFERSPSGQTQPQAFQLTLERERFTVDEQQTWIDAWQQLSRSLNPRHPLSDRADGPTPNWVTLEITNPSEVPTLYWRIPVWAGVSKLNFGAGDLNLILSDRALYDPANPPTSLARISPTRVEVNPSDDPRQRDDGQLRIVVQAGDLTEEPVSSQAGTLVYTYAVQSEEDRVASIQETLSAAQLRTAFSPIETPQFLRTVQNLPTPEWSAGSSPQSVDPALLWGFMPLENGWAQLPVPNLTEQIYLDSEVENALDQAPAASLLQGAVSLGNDRPAVLQQYRNEQPWNLTLTDTRALKGIWRLTPQADGFRLAQIQIDFFDPDVTLNGFFWLSTGKPRIEDALPDLENWVSGLRSLPLQTAFPDTDLFPAPVLIEWDKLEIGVRPSTADLPVAALQNWIFSYQAEPQTLRKLVNKGVLPANTFGDYPPLVWQRHSALPMIQALPLTQSQTPANYPSASRQLVPYQLAVTTVEGLAQPQNWTFGVSDDAGATAWPRLIHPVLPAEEWRSRFDLPLVSLSLPGLILDPKLTAADIGLGVDAGTQLPCQYRFDLPYTDEFNALAQLPKTPPHPEQVSPLPDSLPPEPPEPLTRETFAAHWQRLSELASLAQVGASEAFVVSQAEGQPPQTGVQNLIEPFLWPIQPQLDLNQYPGHLALQDGAAVTLSGETALEGFSGPLFLTEDQQLTGATQPDQRPLSLTAGSLAAHPGFGGFRDQRGLMRFATELTGSLLAKTSVIFHRDLEDQENYELTTTLQPIALQVGDASMEGAVSPCIWRLWFRDLPVQIQAESDTLSLTHIFDRQSVRSDAAQDINDPEARSREHDFLTGYEWRLAADVEGSYLPLFGLHFYPLTLETLQVEDDQIRQIMVIGRLQLPLSDRGELQDFSNAVRVTFQADTEHPLRLDAVELVGVGEWPLALLQGEATDAPLLTWRSIRLNDTKNRIDIEDLQFKFFLFNQVWEIDAAAGRVIQWFNQSGSLTASPILSFSASSHFIRGTYAFPTDAFAPLAPQTLDLILNVLDGGHQVSLGLAVQLGRDLDEGSASNRPAFVASVRYPILGSVLIANTNQLSREPVWESAILFDDLTLAGDHSVGQQTFLATPNALQFQWQHYRPKDPSKALQLLPGLCLRQDESPEAPGFAALTFETVATSDGVPHLQLKTAFMETLLSCRWGAFLQTSGSPSADTAIAPLVTGTRQQVFGSSAGDLVCGYTTQWQAETQTWTETLLLNGVMEIKNLISWPKDLTVQSENGQTTLTLPARQAQTESSRSLHHLRHTLRILFNQHRIPEQLLVVGEGNLLFQLHPNQVWQFEAVVEHQLVEVLGIGETDLPLGHDRRWTVVQEVRWLTPQGFKTFLLDQRERTTVDPRTGINTLGSSAGGYLETQLRTRLAEGNLPELDRLSGQTLLVEASAHHWIRQIALAGKSTTTLQFLPNGSQLGILSNPQDYAPSDPRDPEWLLLTLPFLGRLQDYSCDGLDLLPSYGQSRGIAPPPSLPSPSSQSSPPPPSPLTPLQTDPILYLAAGYPNPALALIFASWGGEAAVDIAVSGFDTAAGRSWARLDALSLEENWFRLQHPVPESLPSGLQSVLATLPDTPARLSRPTALRQAISSFRATYPPSLPSALPPIESLASRPVWQPNSLLVTEDVPLLDGLQVLYTFREGSGDTIRDVSGVGVPLNLRLERAAATTQWIPGGGLRIVQPTLIRSAIAATKITEACRETNEITIEAWVKPANDERLVDEGPARIVTLSADTNHRNVTLAQGPGKEKGVPVNAYLVRLRTSETDDNATDYKNKQGRKQAGPVMFVPAPRIQKQRLDHVVYTRDRDGVARVYINGQLAQVSLVEGVASTEVRMSGDFSNWNAAFHLALANELSVQLNPAGKGKDTRSWLGDYYRVAIYDRALSAIEVNRQYQRGHQGAPDRPLHYSWVLTGLQLASSRLASPADGLERYAAATLLPIQLHAADRKNRSAAHPEHSENPQPVSFSVSPYLGLDFQPAPVEFYSLQLVSTELLCLDPATQALLPVASYFWDDLTDFAQRSVTWAQETHLRLSPDSPIAVLRSREVRRLNPDGVTDADPGSLAPIATTYAFAIVTDIQPPVALARRVFPLRAPVDHLRFREGQFSGSHLPPATLQPFEIAPPQTIGVQPLYLTTRPGSESQDEAWPWGLSALRISVQYTSNQQGAVGSLETSDPSLTLWWQAPQYAVQYRAGIADLPAAGLPPKFRAAAIQSFLSVVPTPPMPEIAVTDEFNATGTLLDRWQPILPGGLRYLMIGDRAGAMFAIRNQLLRQSHLLPGLPTMGEVLVSGSLPVQHRMPRPVPLPLNSNREKALQPWASYFERDRNALVTLAPADEAFFGETVITIGNQILRQPAQRLQMQLKQPQRGAIDSQWKGELSFEIRTEMGDPAQSLPIEDWEIDLAIVKGSQTVRYSRTSASDASEHRFEPHPDQIVQLQDLLTRLVGGDQLTVQATVMPKTATDNFRQTLSFPLRRTDETLLRLPLEPWFIQFEDPEYNRQLASPAAHASRDVRVPPALSGDGSAPEQEEEKLVTVKLSVDRREYNPDSILSLRYDWSDPVAGQRFNATLSLQRISTNGIKTELSVHELLSERFKNLPAGELVQFSLTALRTANSTTQSSSPDQPGQPESVLRPDDVLELTLSLRETGKTEISATVILTVNLVQDPVMPATEAAYALLRRQAQGGTVECVRFAWGPMPSRVELINASDLQTEVVRRRAVFQWTDTARSQTLGGYAVQKITSTGSTHFPENFES